MTFFRPSDSISFSLCESVKNSNKESHFKSDEYFEHDPQILPKDKIFFYRAALCKRDRFVTRKTSSFKNANTVQSFDT